MVIRFRWGHEGGDPHVELVFCIAEEDMSVLYHEFMLKKDMWAQIGVINEPQR